MPPKKTPSFRLYFTEQQLKDCLENFPDKFHPTAIHLQKLLFQISVGDKKADHVKVQKLRPQDDLGEPLEFDIGNLPKKEKEKDNLAERYALGQMSPEEAKEYERKIFSHMFLNPEENSPREFTGFDEISETSPDSGRPAQDI